MALFSDKSWDEWVEEYSQSHQHPINRWCHSVGIPMIVLSLLLLVLVPLAPALVLLSSFGLFCVGWVFQFVGHYYEKKPPEFLKDWRFLFVRTRWWLRKIMAK
ncbi:MAG: YGL010W-like membrane protein [Lentisphaeria bacterium]|jgi:uncharacterized membrane protein YGL010W